MPVTIAGPTTSPTSVQKSRVIDRCQNGVLWTAVPSGSTWTLYYSTDNGATWTAYGTTITASQSFSFFIDDSDYIHIAYFDANSLYYRRGTPNAGRTSWTLNSATTLVATSAAGIVWELAAFTSGTDTYCGVLYEYWTGGAYNTALKIMKVTSGDVTTTAHTLTIKTSDMLWASIDFEHTGDFKTAGASPDFYVAYGNTGNVYFKKVGYSAGPSWAVGTERTIVAERWVFAGCFYDATQVTAVIAGFRHTSNTFRVLERDAADTTTTDLQTGTVNSAAYVQGTMAMSPSGDLFMFGTSSNEASNMQDVEWLWWDRSADLESSVTVLDTAVLNDATPIAKKHGSNGLLEVIWCAETANPFNVVYDSISLNSTPDTPTNLVVTSVSTDTTPNFSCSVNDVDFSGSEQVKARFTIQTAAGAAVGTVDSSFRSSAGTCTAEYTSALSIGQYRVAARAIDDDGAESADTAWVYFDVTTLVTKDQQYIWDIFEQINKDLVIDFDTILYTPAEVDLALDWAVFGQIQKDLNITFDVTIPVELDLELIWDNRNGWVDIPIYNATWTEKALAP